MNLIATKFNNPSPTVQTMPVSKANMQPQTPNYKSENKNDFYKKNKPAILATSAVAIAGIVLGTIQLRRGKIDKTPKTHIERLNYFGKKIIEELKYNKEGKLLQKEIEFEGSKYIANYTNGKLSDIEGYIPRKIEDFTEDKYCILKEIIDKSETELIVSREFGLSTKYWLFDKTGGNVTQINEIKVDANAPYQYLNYHFSPEKSFAYEIDETFPTRDNIPFAEIYENFKKGLL